nr:MAG TPA: hypothetical protein [Caudoviricetes sp.]
MLWELRILKKGDEKVVAFPGSNFMWFSAAEGK